MLVEAFFLAAFWIWTVSAAVFLSNTLPPREKYAPVPNGEPVGFASIDGIPLHGWILRGRADAPWILFCQSWRHSSAETAPIAADLNRAGFNALLMDARAHGRSGGHSTSFGFREINDVFGALVYLSQVADAAPKPIGILGISMGATTALLAAAYDDRLAAVVADSPCETIGHLLANYVRAALGPLSGPLTFSVNATYRLRFGQWPWHISPRAAAARLAPRPLLLIGGKQDNKTPLQGVQAIFESAGEPKHLWLGNGGHREAYRKNPEDYIKRVRVFFEQALIRSAPASSIPSSNLT